MEFKKYIDTNIEGRKVKAEVYYSVGGYNTKRGYYLSTMVVDLKDEDGWTSESMELFNNGYRQLVKEVGRKSDKQFNEACVLAEPMIKGMIDATLARRKDGLTLE